MCGYWRQRSLACSKVASLQVHGGRYVHSAKSNSKVKRGGLRDLDPRMAMSKAQPNKTSEPLYENCLSEEEAKF